MIEVFRFPSLPGLLQTGASGAQWFLAGVLTAIALYHLVVSVQTRHRAMFWLGLYTAALCILLFTPLADRVLGLPAAWQRVLAALLVVVCGSALTVNTLHLQQHRPRLRVALYGACALLALLSIAALSARLWLPRAVPYDAELISVALLGMVVANAVIASVIYARDRRRNHLLYTLAWLLALLALPLVWWQAPQEAGQSIAGWLLLGHVLLLAFAMAERVNHLEEQLQRSEIIEDGQRELFGRVEHLTTTHIHAALGAAELLRLAPRREYLGIVERSVQGLLRDMSVAEANAALARGDSFGEPVEMALRQMVNHVLAGASALATVKRVVLYGVIDPVLPGTVHADVRHLQCLLSVALDHGLRHCAGSEVVLRVEGVMEQPERARFVLTAAQAAVTAGGWRDPELQDWLQRMAVALGGSGGLSARGSRLELWLELPVFDAAAQPEPTVSRDLEPGRVLIIDDQDAFRVAAAALLRQGGNDIETAVSADELIAQQTNALGSGQADTPENSLSLVAERDWDWDGDGPSESTAADDPLVSVDVLETGSAQPELYDHLVIASSSPDHDNSPALIEQLQRSGISAAAITVLLPTWLAMRKADDDGSINRIHRPLLVDELADELAQVNSPHKAMRGLRALLAVADEDLAAVIAAILRNLGCKVSIANSGRLLMHRYTRGRHGLIAPYDLVLLEDSDDGHATARQIREFEASRGPQRICMLVLTRPAERTYDGAADGFDAAISLPPTIARLRVAVQVASRAKSETDPAPVPAAMPDRIQPSISDLVAPEIDKSVPGS